MPREFEQKHIELIFNLPINAIVGPTPANWSKPFWFRYFWQEAVSRKSEFVARWKPITDFFNEAFKLPYKWDPDSDEFDKDEIRSGYGGKLSYKGSDLQWRVRTLQTRMGNPWPQSVSNATLLACLQALLEAGFSRVRAANGVVTDSSLQFIANSVRLQGSGDSYFCDFGWRGDGRDFDTLVRSGGFFNRADSSANGFAQSCNLREDWHPFAVEDNRFSYWFREGQSDNCLHTCVSVAMNFKTASTFPLLEGKLRGKTLPSTLVEAQTASTPTAAFSKVGVRTAGGGEVIYRYADRQQLYLVMLAGAGFNTKAKQQQQFPEIAVKFVPAANILACLVFVRVFHGTDEDHGFTLLYDAARSQPPTEDKCKIAIADGELAKLLFRNAKRLFDQTVQSMPYAAKWTPGGADPAPQLMVDSSPATITKVSKLDGTTFWP